MWERISPDVLRREVIRGVLPLECGGCLGRETKLSKAVQPSLNMHGRKKRYQSNLTVWRLGEPCNDCEGIAGCREYRVTAPRCVNGTLNCCQSVSDPFLWKLSETELSVNVGTFLLSLLVGLWHSWSTAVTSFTITLGGRTRKPLPCVFLLCAFDPEAY